MARDLGLILCAWVSRVSYAKTRDPRRPIALRKAAHSKRVAWLRELFDAVTDDGHDSELFPGQEWESPFLPNARDGGFV